MKFIFLAFLLFLIGGTTTMIFANQKVRLMDVDVLTFQKGELTTGRRSTSILQLQCTGGAAQSESNLVETVQCKNSGFDGRDVNWECKTHLEPHLKLGKTQVSCEGYDDPDDPFILIGSCGLEYTLEYTNGRPPVRPVLPVRPVRPMRPVRPVRLVPGRPVPPVRLVPDYTTHTTIRQTQYVDGQPTSFFVLSMICLFVFAILICWWCTPTTLRRQRKRVQVYSGTTGGSGSQSGGSPPVVVVDNTRESGSSSSSFVNGVLVGSLLTNRKHPSTHTHTHTTETVIVGNDDRYDDRNDEQDYLPPTTTETSKPTEESTSFAVTKRR